MKEEKRRREEGGETIKSLGSILLRSYDLTHKWFVYMKSKSIIYQGSWFICSNYSLLSETESNCDQWSNNWVKVALEEH